MSLAEALALHRAGRRRDAKPLYQRALAQRPDDPQILFAFGLCLLEDGALGDGIKLMRRLVQLQPRHAPAAHALGKALALSGDAAGAEAQLRRAIELAPENPDSWIELGNLLAGRRPADAEATLRAALKRHAAHAGLWCNLGNVLGERERAGEAREAWQQALKLKPDLAEAELALALQRRAAGDANAAVAMLERAIARRPAMAELHYNLGVTYFHARRLDAAIAALERAASGPRPLGKAAVHLAQAAQAACDWARLERLQPALRAQIDAALAGRACDISPFFSLSLPMSEAERAAIARAKAREVEARVAADREAAALDKRWPARDASGPIRVGYLCSDFRDHPTSHLMSGAFALHDRAKVHVTAYSYGPDDGSIYRRRVEQGADAFVELASMNFADAARRIASAGTQVLVDLNGWIANSRPEIAAMRPAPVQATYLGFPGTTGAAFFQYALTDRVVTPPGAQAHYEESLVWLPGCYQVNDRAQAIGAQTTRAAEGLPQDAFVFCCFCANFKIEKRVFAIWMRLLQLAPRSVLWLFAESPEAERNLRAAARDAGLGDARLIFATRKAKADHLARLKLADLFLDTLIYGAHTTASDALWAGVPVLTCRGDAFAGRVGASLLQAVGLPELAVADVAAYEAAALRLALEPAALASLRDRLGANRTAAALFDTERAARGLERAIEAMWGRHRDGLPAAPIDLGQS